MSPFLQHEGFRPSNIQNSCLQSFTRCVHVSFSMRCGIQALKPAEFMSAVIHKVNSCHFSHKYEYLSPYICRIHVCSNSRGNSCHFLSTRGIKPSNMQNLCLRSLTSELMSHIINTRDSIPQTCRNHVCSHSQGELMSIFNQHDRFKPKNTQNSCLQSLTRLVHA